MRLIDADALLRSMSDPMVVEDLVNNPPFIYADVVDAVIDAAPTVECAECEHDKPTDLSHSCDYCKCGSEFRRRQS